MSSKMSILSASGKLLCAVPDLNTVPLLDQISLEFFASGFTRCAAGPSLAPRDTLTVPGPDLLRMAERWTLFSWNLKSTVSSF